MDEKMLDLQNLMILRGSYKATVGVEDSRRINNDTCDIMLREYLRDVDRGNGLYSNYNMQAPLRFNKVQEYDATLNFSRS
ncbi:MAG: hypothetical protein ACUZ8O_14150 [Candidatus Anammoxibacter sp.]